MDRAIQDVIGTQARRRKRGLISYKASTRLVPLLYVSPATLLFCLLTLFPMIMVIRYSLLDGAIVNKNAGFAGWQNYRAVFEDPVFWQSVWQTLYFTVMSVILWSASTWKSCASSIAFDVSSPSFTSRRLCRRRAPSTPTCRRLSTGYWRRRWPRPPMNASPPAPRFS